MNEDSKRLENENKVLWKNYTTNIKSKEYCKLATTNLRDLTVKLIDWNTLMSKMLLLITQSQNTERGEIINDLLGRHKQTEEQLRDIPMTMSDKDGCKEAVFGNEDNFQEVIGGISENIYNFYRKIK